jgi:hypothetical protein
MARHPTTGPGSGKVELDRRPSFVVFKLVNFDIDDEHLKPGHVDFIEREILPLLKTPNCIRARLMGEASRTGAFSYDMQLGQRRSDNVKDYLFRQLTDRSKALPIDTGSVGFTQAKGKSDVDGADDRAVLVEVFLSLPPPKPGPIPPPPPPVPSREPDYIKKGSAGDGIPMFQVPGGSKLIQTNADNSLSFSAGTIVDCWVRGAGVGHVTISEGNEKRTVIPNINGSVEEFDRFGKVPAPWTFNFKIAAGFGSAGTASVICYSEWVKGLPLPPQ